MSHSQLGFRRLVSAIASGTLLAGCGGDGVKQRAPSSEGATPRAPSSDEADAEVPSSEAERPASGTPRQPAAPAGVPRVGSHARPTPSTPPTADAGTAGVDESAPPSGAAEQRCDMGSETRCYAREQLERLVRYGGGQMPLDPPRSDAEVEAAFLDNGCLPPHLVFDGCCNPAVSGPTKSGAQCCYVHCTGVCCGRPLIVEGLWRVAPEAPRGDWAAQLGGAGDGAVSVDAPELRARLARAWSGDALLEHASVASLARFTLELLAVGAPPELVREAQRAGLDEIEHARLCFGLAARFGEVRGPGRLELEDVTVRSSLARVTAAVVREGCVGETLASVVASEQRAVATDAAVRQVLERVADDEARHAELAWRFVAWAIAVGGGPVRAAVRSAFDEALRERGAPVGWEVAPEEVPAWHAAGRLTAAEVTRLEHDVKTGLLARAAEWLLDATRESSARQPAGRALGLQAGELR